MPLMKSCEKAISNCSPATSEGSYAPEPVPRMELRSVIQTLLRRHQLPRRNSSAERRRLRQYSRQTRLKSHQLQAATQAQRDGVACRDERWKRGSRLLKARVRYVASYCRTDRSKGRFLDEMCDAGPPTLMLYTPSRDSISLK